jgi:hypothetical protein
VYYVSDGGFGLIFGTESLCKMAVEWGIDGWVRMEAGFEIIYCDFTPGAGLRFLSQHGSAFADETGKPSRVARRCSSSGSVPQARDTTA